MFASLLPAAPALAEWPASRLFEFTAEACAARAPGGGPNPDIVSRADEVLPLEFRGRRLGTRYRFGVEESARVELAAVERGGSITRFVSTLSNRFGDPLLLVSIDGECEFIVVRRIDYTDRGQAISITSLDRKLEPSGRIDWLNPPLEFLPREESASLKHPGDATPVRVAMVDSGVNYRLPEINRRLARDSRGKLIGFDFWDMDAQPYDANPIQFGFFLRRHGTRTASILLREAPGIELVPYRYPRPDMSRMQALVEDAVRHGVTIVGLPLGSDRLEDWSAFEQAAREHPEVLFIASAGNDGRDIDERPLFPASLGLDNLLVVTSSDDFVQPAESTNWGRVSVDYLVPAERVPALDYSGREIPVSGSSYAVARVAALAARLQQAHRQWRAAEIIAEMKRRYLDAAPAARRWVGSGYIGDPRAGRPPRFDMLPEPELDLPAKKGGFLLPLDVLIVDPRWTPRVEQTLRQGYDILTQCAIVKGELTLRAFDGEDYLRDLSTGTAQTLLSADLTDSIRVVFARDTRMAEQYTGEAFGLANTRMRPWLSNSVWLTLDVDDPGIALAHELYHVIANSGAHVEGSANLMQGRTRPGSTNLTPEQCRKAQITGVEHGLLLD